MNMRIWIFLAVALPASVYGQCMQIVGTNQIICPNYANSTPPVWQGPSVHFANPQQAGKGAAQMFIGGAGAGMAVFQRNPNGVPTSAAGMVRGWNNWQQGGAYVQPPMTVPAPRPSYPRW